MQTRVAKMVDACGLRKLKNKKLMLQYTFLYVFLGFKSKYMYIFYIARSVFYLNIIPCSISRVCITIQFLPDLGLFSVFQTLLKL